MKRLNATEMINDAAVELEKLAPKNSQLEIDVKEDPAGHFSTHVKLQTKYRTYFAKKEDAFLYKSFSKAIKAIKAQLEKKRNRHIHGHVSLKHSL